MMPAVLPPPGGVEPPREITPALDFPTLFQWAEPYIELGMEKLLGVSQSVLDGIDASWGPVWDTVHAEVGTIRGILTDPTSQFSQWLYSQNRFLVDWAADAIPERVQAIVGESTKAMSYIFGAAQDAVAGAMGTLPGGITRDVLTQYGRATTLGHLELWRTAHAIMLGRDPAAHSPTPQPKKAAHNPGNPDGQEKEEPPVWGPMTESEAERQWQLYGIPFAREHPELLLEQAGGVWQWVLDRIWGALTAFTEEVTNVLTGAGVTAPPRAAVRGREEITTTIQATSRLMTLGLGALGGLVIMALLGETIGFWKSMGLGQIAAIVWDASSFKLITTAFIGAFTWAVIRQPLRYNINALLRPNLPDMRDISEMYAKKEITTPEFDQAMAYMGIPDDWLDVYHKYIWRDPRLFEVVRIAEIASPDPVPPQEAIEWLTRAGMKEGIGPDWWYWMKFGKGAYDYLDIPILVNVAKMAVARREQTLYLTQIRRLARDGYIDATRTRSLLEAAWVPTPPIQFREAGIALEAEYEEKADLSTMLLMAFSRGLITEGECSQQLIKLGMAGGVAATAVLREKLGLLARPALMRVTPPEEGMAYPEVSEEG